MINKKVLLIISLLCFVVNSGFSQSSDLRASFNKLYSLFKEYEILTPEMLDSSSPKSYVAKNKNITFNYPYITLSYNLAYAPSVTDVNGERPGKRIVKFPILDIKLQKGYDSYGGTPLYISSHSGIEVTTSGQKKLLEKWEMRSSRIVCNHIHDEFNKFKSLVVNSGFTGNISYSINNGNPTNSERKPNNKVVVKLQKTFSGVYMVPCKVNGLSLNFLFDTGASAVQISKSEALFMLKNGYMSENDIVGRQKIQTASGDILEGTRIIIRKIEVGGLVLRNVEATVMHNDNAPLLLGQSVLKRLGKLEIDYQNSTLTIFGSVGSVK